MAVDEILSDDQNFKIDIDKIYEDFIKEINDIRSHTNLTSMDVAIDLDNSAIKLKSNEVPQESRCHAFYRLIGLPVIGAGGDSYSPGFYLTDNGKEDKLSNKKKIADDVPKEVKLLHFLREVSAPTFENIFSTQSVDSSVLALSSFNIRSFAAPLLKGGTPFDPSIPSYTVAGDDTVNNNISFSFELSYYVDENGDQISASSPGLARSRSHIIKPIMVSAPIELTVLPSEKRVSVPFPEDKSKTLIGHDMYVRRPYIELVCRVRFDGRNKIDTRTPSQQETITFIQEDDTFKDLEIIKSISEGVGAVTNESNFIKFFNIIRAMSTELIKAVTDIDKVRSKYLWVPISSKKGPEFGSQTRDLVLKDPNNSNADREIISQVIKQRFAEITGDVLTTTKKDLGNFSLGTIQITPDNSSGLGNINSNNLDNELDKRNSECNKANSALRKIEIIMGEFSGLGFCDIIAIYGALWLIDKKDLLGLLDIDAFGRMKEVPELKSDPDLNNRSTPLAAIEAFEKKVKELYELMDKAHDDARQNNSNVYTSQ